MRSSEKYWVWLNSIQGMTPRRCKQLLERFGSPEEIWRLSMKEWKAAFSMSEGLLQRILDKDREAKLEALMKKIGDDQLQVIHLRHPQYPCLLKNIPDPPIVLYVKGYLPAGEKAIAVVGSRNASPYGMKIAEALARELAQTGIPIVSGMARGIDTYAHKGALHGKGRTVAVLGCGAEQAYPPENRALWSEIAAAGAVISEYPPGTPPLPHYFPARNRIISGISMGVIVIEAGEKSGSLITADFALEQGREVFAIPGNVNSATSKGTNKLIREGAKIVTCLEDILEEIKVFTGTPSHCFEPQEGEIFRQLQGLEPEERTLVKLLLPEPLHVDQLAQRAGMEVKTVISLLFMLELKGMIAQMPGKIFKIRD